MTTGTRLNQYLPDLLDTLRRFPVAAACAAGLCFYLFFWMSDSLLGSDYDVALGGSAGFLAAGAGHLFAEGRGMSRLGGFVCALIVGSLGFAAMFFFNVAQTSELFLFGGLGLLLMVAGYLNRNATQAALWLFNMRFGLAIGLALVVALVFGLGLSAVIAGLDFLLNIDLSQKGYERVWILATTLVGPLYGLSLMPQDLAEEIRISEHKGSLVERGVSVLVNYVMVPLALVYAAILHAYAVKIIINGGLPKGEIGTIVSMFAVGGTATWLIGWPWREQGTVLLRLFMRAWFWLLPVPAVLLSMAIWRRVADYGMTPDRYGVGLIAVWTGLLFLYLLLRRNRADMRVILGSMAVLLLVGSVGPMGAFGTTARSQLVRLETLLVKVGALKDGKVTGVKVATAGTEVVDGNSMLQALREVRGLNRVRGWFGPDKKFDLTETRDDNWGVANDMAVALGFGYNNAVPNAVNFSAQVGVDIVLEANTRLIGPYSVYRQANPQQALGQTITAIVDGTQLVLTIDGKTTRVALPELLAKLQAAQRQGEPNALRYLSFAAGSDVTLLIPQAYGTVGEKPELQSMTFWILLKQP